MIYVLFKDDIQDDHSAIYLCTTEKNLAINSIYRNKYNFSSMECWDTGQSIFEYTIKDKKLINSFDDILNDIKEQAKIAGIELV